MTTIHRDLAETDLSIRRTFTECFNNKPFLFTHNLHSNPLMSLGAIRDLARAVSTDPNQRGFFIRKDRFAEAKWGTPEFHDELDRAFEDMDASRMRLKLSRINTRPGYRELVQAYTGELDELSSGTIGKSWNGIGGTLFIASPGEVTGYHIDREAGFLVQTHGVKTVYIFDGNDREVISWADIENYWFGGWKLTLPEEMKSRAMVFELRPGLGVHIPLHFPHWVQNGNGASVSLSLGFLPAKHPEDILQANHYLRKCGLSPTPPGRHPALDRSKARAVRLARSVKRSLKGFRRRK